MKGTTSASRRPLERGQFNWVTAVLLTVLLGGAYLALTWAPVYWLHNQVKQATRAAMHEAVHQRDDQKLVIDLCQALGRLEQFEQEDGRGRVVKVPVVEVAPSEVTWERDVAAKPPMLHVAFQYVREVRYPWIDKSVEKTLSVDLIQDIEIPRW
jgi:hypothetical protein